MKIQTATWQGLRAQASAPVRLSLILGSREKGGNAKGMYHSGNRRSEEGHIQVCPQQKTSNGLGSSNLVCKSPRETKWNPSTWVLCYRCSTVCLSLCSSRDLSEPDMKMEVEGAADGHNFSSVWSGLITRWDGLLQKQMAMGIVQWLNAWLACLSEALGSIPSVPHVCTHLHKGVIAPFNLKAIWIRYPIQDRHIQAILCFYYLLIILSLKT